MTPILLQRKSRKGGIHIMTSYDLIWLLIQEILKNNSSKDNQNNNEK